MPQRVPVIRCGAGALVNRNLSYPFSLLLDLPAPAHSAASFSGSVYRTAFLLWQVFPFVASPFPPPPPPRCPGLWVSETSQVLTRADPTSRSFP